MARVFSLDARQVLYPSIITREQGYPPVGRRSAGQSLPRGLHRRLPMRGCPGQGYHLLNIKRATVCPRPRLTEEVFDQASCQQREVVKVYIYIMKARTLQGTQELTFCKVSPLGYILLVGPEGRTPPELGPTWLPRGKFPEEWDFRGLPNAESRTWRCTLTLYVDGPE